MFLRRFTQTIFIMLGNGCNMQCKYCLQTPQVHNPLSKDINNHIYDFISQCAEENGGFLHIQFYGGEPLVYFPTIQEIVRNIRLREINCTFSVITNGKAMTDEMVDYFNDLFSGVTISWDGKNVLNTRLYDVFSDENHKARLFRLNHLGLSAVCSTEAYPQEIFDSFQKICNEYKKARGIMPRLNIDPIMDTGIACKELLDMDYDRVYREVKEVTDDIISKIKTNSISDDDYARFSWVKEKIKSVSEFYKRDNIEYNESFIGCSNGLRTLNLDLEGNLYPCHNTSEKAGNIYMDYFDYLKNIVKGDPAIRRLHKCQNCPIVSLCHGGCKLVSEGKPEEDMCKMRLSLYEPIVRCLENIGGEQCAFK